MKITAIAFTTFREAVRQPIPYVLMLVAVLLVLVVGYLPMFTFSVLDDLKMVKDMAVSTSTLVGLLLVIFASVQVISEEIENRTALTVLSKPVRRWEFVLGKFFGLVLLLVAAYVAMTVIFILLTWWGMYNQFADNSNIYPEYLETFWEKFAWQSADQLWRGFLLSFFHALVMTAVAVALCVRLPMVLSVVAYFGVFVVGHLSKGAVGLLERAGPTVAVAGRILSAALPDLETFNVAHEVGLGQTIPAVDILSCLLYALLYSAAILILAVLLFRKRELF